MRDGEAVAAIRRRGSVIWYSVSNDHIAVITEHSQPFAESWGGAGCNSSYEISRKISEHCSLCTHPRVLRKFRDSFFENFISSSIITREHAQIPCSCINISGVAY